MIRRQFAFALLLGLAAAGCRRDDRSDLLPPPGYSDDPPWRFGAGWSELEANGAGESWRWMGGRAEVRLRRRGSAPMKLAIRGHVAKGLLPSPPTLRFTLDGVLLDRFTPPLDGSGDEYVVRKEYSVAAAPPGARETAVLVIESSPTGSAPGDPRPFGLALTDLHWERE